MDVIGRAAPLYRKRGFQAMLFHVTTEDDIGVIDEQGPGEMGAGDSTFASEQQLQQLAKGWPLKRLVAIWNRLPGVQAGDSVHGSPDRHCTHLASHSAPRDLLAGPHTRRNNKGCRR